MKTFQAAANAVVSGPMPEKGHDGHGHGHGHHQHHAGHEERPFSFANAQPLKVRRVLSLAYSERLQNVALIWKNGQKGRHGAGRPFLPFRAILWSRAGYRVSHSTSKTLLKTLEISIVLLN